MERLSQFLCYGTLKPMNHILQLLRSHYIDRYDPTLEQFQLAAQVTVALFISLIIGHFFHREEQLWLGLPAALTCLCNNGACRRTRYLTIATAILASSVGVFLSTVIGTVLWAYMLLCFIVAVIGFYISKNGPPLTMASISTVILITIAGSKADSLNIAIDRSINILIAGGIVLIIISVLFPYRPKALLHKRLRIISYQLKKLTDASLLSSICGIPDINYRTELKDYTLSNLQICRSIITTYTLESELHRWRLLFSLYNAVNSLWLLLSDPGHNSSFNRHSRYLFHINTVLTSCLAKLNYHEPSPAFKQLITIENELLESAKANNEDIASLAFLVQRLRTRIEDYHELNVQT